ncbi:hypothetical protein JOC86_004541 [Bacillus pakistanensis]|uniref:Uncharacterized protein n=1 Tax=Rossellomorea pakistanensis TaxID=992288 RepID=A0ABS2NKC0_9BACI|nr:hypothetical protein [Bacillus pakistanensis]
MDVGIIFAFSIGVGALGIALILISKIAQLEKRIRDLENK